jgi:CBS domain-containing protein
MEAREIMTTDVVSVPPEMPVEDAGQLLLHYRIHGAPVIDAGGQLVGMVSVVDLVGRVGETVADVMTPDPVVAAEDAAVEDLAGLMLDQMVRRIPIVQGGRVVGIVSASDIIRLFLSLHEAPARRGAEPAGRSG